METLRLGAIVKNVIWHLDPCLCTCPDLLYRIPGLVLRPCRSLGGPGAMSFASRGVGWGYMSSYATVVSGPTFGY